MFSTSLISMDLFLSCLKHEGGFKQSTILSVSHLEFICVVVNTVSFAISILIFELNRLLQRHIGVSLIQTKSDSLNYFLKASIIICISSISVVYN